MMHLTIAEVDASKIAKFTMSLDEPTTRWYSRCDLEEIATFQDVCTQFLELFHREIPKQELLRQFYAIIQEPHEIVSQVTIRFQDLYQQLTQDVSVNHLKDTFLAVLGEPLRTTLTLIDFSQ